MSDSLRDQLMQLGFKPAPKPKDQRRDGGRKQGERGRHGGGQGRAAAPAGTRRKGGGGSSEMDLGKAYALRQQAEKAERQRAEQARQEEARLKREARQKLARLLDGKTQNHPEAELPRHFEFGGKIRRVYVTEPQFKAINAGELGVVQHAGRYLLVDAAVAREASGILPGSLALLVDPNAPEGGDEYADPRYQVPDDLVW